MTEMSPAEAVFFAALEQPAAGRAAYLDMACTGDAALRARVEKLLAAHPRVGGFLEPEVAGNETGTFGGSDRLDAGPPEAFPEVEAAPELTTDYPGRDEHVGAVIAGKYTLVEAVGEGGMGSVWRAKQTEPVKRFVAVKLIKAGMDSKQVLARFEAERQALALMDHPNIAKVFDGGLHSHRPFFVMELVKGVPITEYCDHAKLTPKHRLELFVQVCQAIQHAHQKGIIHRDIKPSNVLIALYDDKPVVKVIDFGVAKATGGALTEQTIDTGFGGVVGTPQYMSPEQATFNNLDIDTRSDVYALGVLLYELLTGSPPFPRKELEKKGLMEILRVVREEEPPRPSTRLSTANALPTLSANRGTEPRRLTGLLRNELDWLVMKALEKDRARRYETANGFAADVQRYLGGEAVQAHPPSTAYRLKKFARRNKGQVIAASLLFLTLLIGLAGTSWGFIRAEQQRRIAELSREAEAERAEGEAKQRQRAEIGEKLAGERLELVVAERDAKDIARADAEAISQFLGEVFQSPDPIRDGRTITVAETLSRAANKLTADRAIPAGPRARLQNTLARTYFALGMASQAIPLQENVRDYLLTRFGPEYPGTLAAMSDLVASYFTVGRRAAAIALQEDVLERMRKVHGPEHLETLTAINNLSTYYAATGRRAEALKLQEEALAICYKVSGPEHPLTLISMNNLACSYGDIGRQEKAIQLQEKVLIVQKKVNGLEHPETLTAMNNLAGTYAEGGRRVEALRLQDEVLALRRKVLGPDHPHTLLAMNNLAESYAGVGRQADSLQLREGVLALRRKVLGWEHPDTLWSMKELGASYTATGKAELAMTLRREVLALSRKQYPNDSTELAQELAHFGHSLLQANAYAEAEPLLRESLAIRLTKEPDDWRTYSAKSLLGGAMLGQKKYADSEPLLLSGYEGMKQREKTIPLTAAIRIPESLDRLIDLYTATNKRDDVRKWRAERAKYPPFPLPVAPQPREMKR